MIKMNEYTSKITQEFLTEINDGDSIAELLAIQWSTLEGKIRALQQYIDITDDQAKVEIDKWLKSRE